jgi:hypothetical protein
MHQTKHHVTVDATLASHSEGPRFVSDREFPSGLSQFLAANIFMAPWNVKKAYFEIISNKLFVIITQLDAI